MVCMCVVMYVEGKEDVRMRWDWPGRGGMVPRYFRGKRSWEGGVGRLINTSYIR